MIASALVIATVATVAIGVRMRARSAPSQRLDARALGFRILALADQKQIREGVAALTGAAEHGDVEAEVALGRIYLQGVPGVPKDAQRALDWLTRAERAHHPSAAYFRGVMSQNGIGMPADAAAAARWFEVAAMQGSPHAMFMLANAYRAGAGVPKDEARALALYQKAAELDDAAALQTLAMAYLHGELGLEPDEIESRRYAAEAEHAVDHAPALP